MFSESEIEGAAALQSTVRKHSQSELEARSVVQKERIPSPYQLQSRSREQTETFASTVDFS